MSVQTSSLPPTAELEALARRVVWFKPPDEALKAPAHFVAHALTYGTHADTQLLRRYLSDDNLLAMLADAPAGVFDARSWAYWHLLLSGKQAPPLPTRKLAGL